jgi:serine/threonine protein kinase
MVTLFSATYLLPGCLATVLVLQKHIPRAGTPAFLSQEVLFDHVYAFEVNLWDFSVILYEMLSGKQSSRHFLYTSRSSFKNLQEVSKTDTVSPDDPTWLHHLSEHIKCNEPVIFESPLMTEDAADLVSQVGFFNFTVRIGFDAIAQLLRKDRDSRLSDITEIGTSLLWGNVGIHIAKVHKH